MKGSEYDGDDDYEEYEKDEYTCAVRKLIYPQRYSDENQQRHKLSH